MTRQRRLKALVRERMKQTGERYAAARRHVIAAHRLPDSPHLPGSNAASTALRILLSHAGVRNPSTGEPLSEAMTFGIAGGVGIGVFSFYYEKEDFASFFAGGRHLWHDFEAYLAEGARRFGATPKTLESSSAKAGEKQLREALASGGPVAAWVDMTHLPHRGMPQTFSGGGYHVITVYGVDDETGTASIGDLTDDPIDVPLADLATARGRIKKDKHRLMWLEKPKASPDLKSLVRQGLAACCDGLVGAGAPKQAKRNFSLDALSTWADRLESTNPKDSERWERVFAPGRRMWSGLQYLHLFVEYYGTGGGLCRPLMAEFLSEAAKALEDPRLAVVSHRYASLGKSWSELADAALPDSIADFRLAKELMAQQAELLNSGGDPDEKRFVWKQLSEIGDRCRERFPLDPSECAGLRSELAVRVRAIHAAEVEAREAMLALAG